MLSKNKIIIILIFVAIFAGIVYLAIRPISTDPVPVKRGPVVAGLKTVEPVPAEVIPIIEDKFELLAVGDIMLDRNVGALIKKHKFDWLFDRITKQNSEFFNGYDLVSANLEAAVTNKGAHYPPVASNDFAIAPSLVEQLKKYNFNYLSIANNHIVDQGQRGYSETVDNIGSLGITYSGAPDSVVDQRSVYIKEIDVQKVALVALSMVYHDFDLEKAKKIISDSKLTADLVIVNIHWGAEYKPKFSDKQQVIGRALIDAGADLIIGHHPHVFQGMEIYQGKAIFYSLGNFIFDQYWSVETQRGLAVGVIYQNNHWQFNLFGLGSKTSQPFLVSGAAKDRFLSDFAQRSKLDRKYLEQLKSGVIIVE